MKDSEYVVMLYEKYRAKLDRLESELDTILEDRADELRETVLIINALSCLLLI